MAADPRVEYYLGALPLKAQRHMEQLREAIRSAAPGAVESFGYGMPAFAFNGKCFLWYGAWKQHSSLYPVREGEGYVVSGKGTIKFPFDEPVPTALVKRLVKARVGEVLGKRGK